MKIQNQIDLVQDKIDKLEAEKKTFQKMQSACKHLWSPTVYNPYEGREEYATGNYETHGIHMWPIMSSRSVSKPRWTRTCTECGLVEHTEKQRDIKTVKQEPDFN